MIRTVAGSSNRARAARQERLLELPAVSADIHGHKESTTLTRCESGSDVMLKMYSYDGRSRDATELFERL